MLETKAAGSVSPLFQAGESIDHHIKVLPVSAPGELMSNRAAEGGLLGSISATPVLSINNAGASTAPG